MHRQLRDADVRFGPRRFGAQPVVAELVPILRPQQRQHPVKFAVKPGELRQQIIPQLPAQGHRAMVQLPPENVLVLRRRVGYAGGRRQIPGQSPLDLIGDGAAAFDDMGHHIGHGPTLAGALPPQIRRRQGFQESLQPPPGISDFRPAGIISIHSIAPVKECLGLARVGQGGFAPPGFTPTLTLPLRGRGFIGGDGNLCCGIHSITPAETPIRSSS